MSMASPEQQSAARGMKLYKHCKTSKPGKIQRHLAALAVRSAPARRAVQAQMQELATQLRFARWNETSGHVQQARSEIVLHLLKKIAALKEMLCTLFAPCLFAPSGIYGSGNSASTGRTCSGTDPPNNVFTDFNNSNNSFIKSMAKSLTSKLKTGAMIGLAGLALGATAPKAKADLFYDSGNLSSTTPSGSGYLKIDYRQTIDEIDTNGDSIIDSYKSSLYVKNSSQDNVGGEIDGSFYQLLIAADLAGRGATDIVDKYSQFHYETTGEDMGAMILNSNGEALPPGFSDTFYYTIAKDQVLGWENVDAAMVANAGAVSFGLQAFQTIPEPTTMALLASGALAALGIRRIKEDRKQAA